MEDFIDIFPWAELVPVQTEPAPALGKPFDTLPTEVLDLILREVNQRALKSLVTVNSRCRSLAIRNLYSSITINGENFEVLPKSPEVELEVEATAQEILERGKIKGCEILRRVLASKEHMASVRTIKLVEYPPESQRPRYFNLLKHLFTNATSLKSIEHQYYPGSLPLVSWPASLHQLKSTHVCKWVKELLKAPSMRSFCSTACGASLHDDLSSMGPITHIRHFEHQRHDWTGRPEAFNFDWIVDVFPNLRSLKISICSCWSAENIPLKFYQEGITRLASQLENLTHLHLIERVEMSTQEQEAFLKRLRAAQPLLEEVTFEATSYQSPMNRWRSFQTDKLIWSPDPTYSAANNYLWWFQNLGIPQISRPEMLRRWPEQEIPSERVLYENLFLVVRARVECHRSTGKCACVLCTENL